MAGAAFHLVMPVAQFKIRALVIKGIFAEICDILVPALMFRMAGLALPGFDIRYPAMPTHLLFDIAINIFMAVQTAFILIGFLEILVALIACGFITGMGLGNLTRH